MTEPQDVAENPLAEALRANGISPYVKGTGAELRFETGFAEALAARGYALVRTPETLDVDYEEMRKERGWPTPNHMRRTADVLDSLTPARYGDVLRWFADLADAALPASPADAALPASPADAALPASPAPDPGAGLREAAQEVIAADGAVARQEAGADRRWDEALAALDAALAPSAEPPETT